MNSLKKSFPVRCFATKIFSLVEFEKESELDQSVEKVKAEIVSVLFSRLEINVKIGKVFGRAVKTKAEENRDGR